jgi:hypothetical protein
VHFWCSLRFLERLRNSYAVYPCFPCVAVAFCRDGQSGAAYCSICSLTEQPIFPHPHNPVSPIFFLSSSFYFSFFSPWPPATSRCCTLLLPFRFPTTSPCPYARPLHSPAAGGRAMASRRGAHRSACGATSGGSWDGGDAVGMEMGQQAGRGEVTYSRLDHGSIRDRRPTTSG